MEQWIETEFNNLEKILLALDGRPAFKSVPNDIKMQIALSILISAGLSDISQRIDELPK